MLEQVFRDWQFWAAVILVGAGYVELRVIVGRHRKLLNGPFQEMQSSLAALGSDIKGQLAVINERLTTRIGEIASLRAELNERSQRRDDDIKSLRDEMREERNKREDATRRIWDKIGEDGGP